MLQRSQWPPDYSAELRRRYRLLIRMRRCTPREIAAIYRVYADGAEGCVAFIEDWCETFDPRNAGSGRPTRMAFKLFPKQVEMIEFLWACYSADADGLIEKSRDMGATWLCVCFAVWLFCFHEGATVGFGSRKAASVDKIGDMSSIFEKLRFQMLSIPQEFWPKGFDPSAMMAHCKIYAPNSNSITGESGDDVGRGGRTRIYFKDESAHYEHPEMIEASLGDNTRVQIDISSVNGLGNVFHRKREGGVEWLRGQPAVRGKTNVFVMDWSDHPAKDRTWYEERENKAIDEGLLHVFRQEVDRDYAASVEGVIIPAEWVKAAIDAHVLLKFPTEGWGVTDEHAALDVADEGNDRNAYCRRTGPVLREIDEWTARDTAVTARKCVDNVSGCGKITVEYDCIGVGAGVKAEVNRLAEDGLLPASVQFTPWNAGSSPLDPDAHVDPNDDQTPLNKDFYQNLKAQGWWNLRRRFEKTFQAVKLFRDGKPHNYDPIELISIPSDLPKLRTLQKELSQPTAKKSSKMRLMVDKTPDGTRSPNMGDVVMMCYFPAGSGYDHSMDWV